MLEEDQKWANIDETGIKTASKLWAKKYTLCQLRELQGDFINHLKVMPELTDSELCGEDTINSLLRKATLNRLTAINKAIDIKEFGE
jgi:hypothetical protein